MDMSCRSRWLVMNGQSSVMYNDTRAAARHGTVVPVCPERIDRIWVVARGVRVIAVSRPKGKIMGEVVIEAQRSKRAHISNVELRALHLQQWSCRRAPAAAWREMAA